MQKNTTSIEDVPLNGFHQLLTVRSGGGWVLDGYILSIIGVALMQVSTELKLSGFWEGMIAASALLGIFFAGFFGGWLTDKLGRQKLYFVPPLLFIACSLAHLWVESAVAIFILRFIIGIGVGIEYPVASSLLVEFLPSKSRGPRLAALTILWFAGAALAYIAGNAILAAAGPEAWHWVLASPALLGLPLLLVRLGTPESARWLVSKGRAAEADRVIKKVYGASFSIANMPATSVEKQASLGTLLQSGYGKRLLFVGVFWACSVIPVFAVYAFVPKVLDALHLTGDWAAYGSIAITLLFVVGCAIATPLVNSMGRRPLLVWSFLLSALALLGLGTFSDGAEWLVLTFFGLYALFIGGAQVLQLVYPNEIFPTDIRAAGVGIGASISRIGAAVGTWLVPISLASIGIGNTMYAAAAVSIVGLLVSIWLAPETRGMSLEDAASLNR